MTDPSDPTQEFQPPPEPQVQVVQQPRTKRVMEFGFAAACIGIVAALVLGFAGGLASHALFPSKQGPAGTQGKEGKQGPVGEAGPAGPAGNAANIDLSNIGYCVNVNYVYSGTVTYVSGVSISSPILTNGTQSCPNGTFTPLQPTSSNP
jgi:hypothetical protein